VLLGPCSSFVLMLGFMHFFCVVASIPYLHVANVPFLGAIVTFMLFLHVVDVIVFSVFPWCYYCCCVHLFVFINYIIPFFTIFSLKVGAFFGGLLFCEMSFFSFHFSNSFFHFLNFGLCFVSLYIFSLIYVLFLFSCSWMLHLLDCLIIFCGLLWMIFYKTFLD